MPPNGVCTRTELFELTDSTPVSSARATRRARAPSRVQIDPDRPVGRVVRDPDCVGLVLEGNDGGDGAEDLLASDAVVVRRLDQGAGEPEAFALGRFAAEGLAFDEGGDGLALLLRDERPHLGAVGRIADADAAVASTSSSTKRPYAPLDQDA